MRPLPLLRQQTRAVDLGRRISLHVARSLPTRMARDRNHWELCAPNPPPTRGNQSNNFYHPYTAPTLHPKITCKPSALFHNYRITYTVLPIIIPPILGISLLSLCGFSFSGSNVLNMAAKAKLALSYII